MESNPTQYSCNKIECQLILPYCIRVPEEEYKFNNKDINVSLTFRRHVRASEFDHFKVGQKNGQNDIIEKERFGRYDYSTVDITLQKNCFDFDPTIQLNKTKELVLSCVRKFIQFYKLAYDEYWIIELSVDDILTFPTKCFKDDENIPRTVFPLLVSSNSNRIMPWQDYLDQKKYNREEMLNRLRTNYDLPLYIQLMMDATTLCSAGSFDIGVILIDRSFESFFDTVVKVYLHQNHIFTKEWEKYLGMDLIGKNAKKSKLKAYSSRVSKSGEEFNDKIDLYTEWNNKCRRLRNDVIHGKRNNIGEQEALDARESARNAFTFFGFSWFDSILIRDQFFDESQNRYDIPIPPWFKKK